MTYPPTPKPQRRFKRQVVAGFIIFRRTHEGIKFLLLYRRGQYWNFPKGHFMEGERSLVAALRETEEETGIRRSELRIIPNFRAQEKFYFQSGNEGIFDIVVLFLAETRRADVRISPREHSGFAWFTYQDALKAVGKKYEATKRALKQAYDFLHRKGPKYRPPHSPRPNFNLPASGVPGR